MDLIDTHCHLDVGDFDADRSRIVSRCHELGIKRIIVPAVMATGWENLLGLCGSDKGLFPALGLHPVYIDMHRSGDVEMLGEWVARYRPTAVGEIGLDYYMEDPDRERQRTLFEAQLRVAREHDLPVLLHVRKAHDETLASLRRVPVPGGIVHAFNGSLQQAHRYRELGFVLGFGGTVTYERSSKIRRLARELPLEALVLETDAPDMAVASHHGERNSPEYLPEVLRSLVEVRGEADAVIAAQTTANAERVLRLDPCPRPG